MMMDFKKKHRIVHWQVVWIVKQNIINERLNNTHSLGNKILVNNTPKNDVKLFLILFFIPLKLIDLQFTCLEFFDSYCLNYTNNPTLLTIIIVTGFFRCLSIIYLFWAIFQIAGVL
jgi:hypothetical protein